MSVQNCIENQCFVDKTNRKIQNWKKQINVYSTVWIDKMRRQIKKSHGVEIQKSKTHTQIIHSFGQSDLNCGEPRWNKTNDENMNSAYFSSQSDMNELRRKS